jgi:DNA-directed RNA polymerase specialized sigma24 family protein
MTTTAAMDELAVSIGRSYVKYFFNKARRPLLEVPPKITRALASLTPREEQILRLYYGIGEREAYTLDEIGERFAVNRERIRQVRNKALKKLVAVLPEVEIDVGRK